MEADNNPPILGSDQWGDGEEMSARCECCAVAG